MPVAGWTGSDELDWGDGEMDWLGDGWICPLLLMDIVGGESMGWVDGLGVRREACLRCF